MSSLKQCISDTVTTACRSNITSGKAWICAAQRWKVKFQISDKER